MLLVLIGEEIRMEDLPNSNSHSHSHSSIHNKVAVATLEGHLNNNSHSMVVEDHMVKSSTTQLVEQPVQDVGLLNIR